MAVRTEERPTGLEETGRPTLTAGRVDSETTLRADLRLTLTVRHGSRRPPGGANRLARQLTLVACNILAVHLSIQVVALAAPVAGTRRALM